MGKNDIGFVRSNNAMAMGYFLQAIESLVAGIKLVNQSSNVVYGEGSDCVPTIAFNMLTNHLGSDEERKQTLEYLTKLAALAKLVSEGDNGMIGAEPRKQTIRS